MEQALTFLTLDTFNYFLIGMAIIAGVVFIALYFIEAGYGMFLDPKWGITISNKKAWTLMEMPVFLSMLVFWYFYSRRFDAVPFLLFLFFQFHYFDEPLLSIRC